MKATLPFLLLAALPCSTAFAQCPVGELEVTIVVNTDDYGNETMWQLVESGNGCDGSPIFTAGNPAINCADAGGQTSPPGGYASNTTFNEGPFCLTEGAQYDIISVDAWGDGQASYTVLIEGGYAGYFEGLGGLLVHPFTVATPVDRDMSLTRTTTSIYCEVGLPVIIAGAAQNVGGQPVTSFDVAYSIDGAPEVTATINEALDPGDQVTFELETPWIPTDELTGILTIRIAGVNGDSDENATNDERTSPVVVNAAVPDIMDSYLSEPPTVVNVANGDQDILVPRDLDFHPDRTRNELWVINKDVFNTGGSTVRFFNPGEADMTFLYQRDPAARHFLSLPTGIAMADNGNFSTCPGVYDANGNQGTSTPFTGPTLWSADPDIYAQNQFGPLGSHLDMLHVTPRSQGIAHERWNKFWIVDGTNQDVVMHDFRADHGPGNDFHGDAIIHRYPEVSITRDPNDHIVSHCVVDKHTGWLYVVDHGGQRVLRLDTRSGTPDGAPSFGPFEGYVEYLKMTNATWEVVISGGLQEPAGIEVVGTHLLVSDHATGEIIIYDMANDFSEEGRLQVGAGVMGIKVAPNGRIWCVNATQSLLIRVEPSLNVGMADQRAANTWSMFPNPSKDQVYFALPSSIAANTVVNVLDASGRLCTTSNVNALTHGLDVHGLAEGVYTVSITGQGTARLVIAR